MLVSRRNVYTLSVDFGFGNYFTAGEELATWCGSPPYAAPEVFEGKRYIGPHIDVWVCHVIITITLSPASDVDGVVMSFLLLILSK